MSMARRHGWLVFRTLVPQSVNLWVSRLLRPNYIFYRRRGRLWTPSKVRTPGWCKSVYNRSRRLSSTVAPTVISRQWGRDWNRVQESIARISLAWCAKLSPAVATVKSEVDHKLVQNVFSLLWYRLLCFHCIKRAVNECRQRYSKIQEWVSSVVQTERSYNHCGTAASARQEHAIPPLSQVPMTFTSAAVRCHTVLCVCPLWRVTRVNTQGVLRLMLPYQLSNRPKIWRNVDRQIWAVQYLKPNIALLVTPTCLQ